MENEILDITGVRGRLAPARKLVNVKNSSKLKAKANRRARRTLRLVLRTGDTKQLRGFRPLTTWDLA